jgi:peptidoglycan/LPS O-acetylase OafA/YrhL
MPGLDGLRTLAVFAVVAYHLGLGWAPAGLLGVGVFFTLSGYLITDLLLAQWDGAGRLALGDFWVRRARRLLPALFVMLVVVVVWVALLDRSQLASLWSAVVAAALYVSNWFDVSQHVSYFARFGPPSPLGHLWSLAIEEQFYLLWPWLLWLGLRYVRERRSAVTGWHPLHHPGLCGPLPDDRRRPGRVLPGWEHTSQLELRGPVDAPR